MMRAVRSRDTLPELAVRSLAHAMGYRFRVAVRGMPGTPDLVFPTRRAVILVHGCFWHSHVGCPRARVPATRSSWWAAKFPANMERDARKEAQLRDAGWAVLVLWECAVPRRAALAAAFAGFLGPPGPRPRLRAPPRIKATPRSARRRARPSTSA